jgi:hypothetical protein
VTKSYILAPDNCGWITDRNTLWDAAEAAESRKNSTTAREWLVALPDALDALQRADLTHKLAVELVERFGVAVDVAIHAPGKDGDQRNHHAHLLTTTRKIGADGMGEKTRILDAAKTGGEEISYIREFWANAVNDALAKAESTARVDHRRKSVIAAELKAEATVLEQQAKDVAAMNSKTSEVGGVLKGLGHAVRALRAGGLSALTSTSAVAAKLQLQARDLRAKAAELSKPLNKHNGPKMTAFFRRMEPIWKKEKDEAQAEADAVAVQKAAEIAAEQAREAQVAANALKVQKEQEHALWLEKRADSFVEYTRPMILRAQTDAEFAERISRWGINLNRPINDVARDPIWQEMEGNHYNAQPIWSALTEEAKDLDRAAKDASDR